MSPVLARGFFTSTHFLCAASITHRRKVTVISFDIELHTQTTASEPERALLIAVESSNQTWKVQDSLEELASLAETVDVEVVGSVTQKLGHPHPATYVGKGKLEEIKNLREELEYNLVMVDGDLNPNAVWSYPEPSEAAKEIKGRVAFWKGVKVEP